LKWGPLREAAATPACAGFLEHLARIEQGEVMDYSQPEGKERAPRRRRGSGAGGAARSALPMSARRRRGAVKRGPCGISRSAVAEWHLTRP